MYEDLIKELRDCRNMAVFSEYWWDITTRAADAIESLTNRGRCFVLPCEIGEKLYDISEFINGIPYPEMYELKADYITFYKEHPNREGVAIEIDGVNVNGDVGVSIFKSKQAAEEAIERLYEGCEFDE